MTKTSAKDKVLKVSYELMSTRGFNATTVDDIVKQAGVAKGSLYHAFKSKEQLAIATLEIYLQNELTIIEDGPYRQIDDPVDRALAFVEYLENRSQDLWSRGCLLGSMAIEIGENYPTIMDQIDRMFNRLEHSLATIFSPALAAKNVVGVTSRDLSLHLLAVIEGSIITSISHSEPQYLQHAIRHFRDYLKLILS